MAARLTRYGQRISHSAALRVFLLALLVYGLSAQVWSHAVSLAPHYVYLAQSLLQGHVDLIQLPPTTYDLLHFNGRWFVAGSPMPSLMLLPFVAIFGVTFGDVLFSVVLGAIDVALVYSLLGTFVRKQTTPAPVVAPPPGPAGAARVQTDEAVIAANNETVPHPAGARHDSNFAIPESARRWITLVFAVGTPFWYLVSLGTYWFTAHVVVVFFTLLATREALTRQRWFIAGLWLACAGFARPTALFLAPFFLIIIFYSSRRSPARGFTACHSSLVTRYLSGSAYSLVRNIVLFGAALSLGLAAHFVYNYARFKSPTDFGYSYVTGADNITGVYARYGGFNPRFAPCNLAVSLLSPPEVNGAVPPFITQACAYLLEGVDLSDPSAPITPNPLGMSIFFVTPALLIVFTPLATKLKRRFSRTSSSIDSTALHSRHVPAEGAVARLAGWEPLSLAAWVGLFTTLIPLWFYHNTGSLQFGWRYLVDAAPLWIILMAAGMQKVTRFKQGLILVSFAINLWGLAWMFEKLNGTSWWNF